MSDKDGRSSEQSLGVNAGGPEDGDARSSTAETPDAAPPNIETSDVALPDVETPNDAGPDVETPDAETSHAASPDVETPDAETPDSPRSGGDALDISRMTVREVREYIAGAPVEPGDPLWAALRADPRKGIRALCRSAERRLRARLSVEEREARMRRDEEAAWSDGALNVAGVDEAGRGPLAGPVVAAAVILPRDLSVRGIDDSKRLTPERREELYQLIERDAVAVGVGIVSEKVIDEINILRATFRAMREAVADLGVEPDHVLVDGDPIPDLLVPQTGLNRGDQRSTVVAAASIIAKVTRDRMLVDLHDRYPGYGFARHKGYGTPEHISALMRLGPCEIHRRSFKVVLDAAGGMSELYSSFRSALLSAEDPSRLHRVADEIAREKDRLAPYEISKLRGLYKRCFVRLKAGIASGR